MSTSIEGQLPKLAVAPAHPPIPVGVSTIAGYLVTAVSLAGTIILAIRGNDPEALKTGVGAAIAFALTHGGRVAQAIVSIARQAGPYVDAVQDAVDEAPAPARSRAKK